jgi:hypothetical protein
MWHAVTSFCLSSLSSAASKAGTADRLEDGIFPSPFKKYFAQI